MIKITQNYVSLLERIFLDWTVGIISFIYLTHYCCSSQNPLFSIRAFKLFFTDMIVGVGK